MLLVRRPAEFTDQRVASCGLPAGCDSAASPTMSDDEGEQPDDYGGADDVEMDEVEDVVSATAARQPPHSRR